MARADRSSGGLGAGWDVAIDRHVVEGYVTFEGDVTFAAGAMTPGQDIFLHPLQPHAFIDGGPFTVILRPGKTTTRTIAISNFDGHEESTFETGEVNYSSPRPSSGIVSSRLNLLARRGPECVDPPKVSRRPGSMCV